MASSRTIASLLWRSQRIYQVFGANTDVGKTIFTTLLCKAAKKLWADETVTFLKPVSTGPDDEADDRCKSWSHISSTPEINTSADAIDRCDLERQCCKDNWKIKYARIIELEVLTSTFESSEYICPWRVYCCIVQVRHTRQSTSRGPSIWKGKLLSPFFPIEIFFFVFLLHVSVTSLLAVS